MNKQINVFTAKDCLLLFFLGIANTKQQTAV